LKHAFDIGQQLLDRRCKLLGAQCRHDTALGSHEKRIVEAFSQSIEHAAHGELGERQAIRSSRHTTLIKQRIQCLEKVEIESSDIRIHDVLNKIWRLVLFQAYTHHGANPSIERCISMNEIIWPKGYLPGFTENFVSNEVIIADLSAAQIWPLLSQAHKWPSYYANSANIQFHDHAGPDL
jgi:hypothetical protein